MNTNNPPLFDKALYFKVLTVTLAIAVVGLFASYFYFSEITVTDTIGTCICAFIVAYMAHLYILMRRNEQGE